MPITDAASSFSANVIVSFADGEPVTFTDANVTDKENPMRNVLASVLLSTSLLFACGESPPPEPAPTPPPEVVTLMPCTPGLQISCACIGTDRGVQACVPDGTGFGPCACAGTPADAGTPDASADDVVPFVPDAPSDLARGWPPGSNLYKPCQTDLDCDPRLACDYANVAVGARSRFCTFRGCAPQGPTGDDPRCDVEGGAVGACVDFNDGRPTVCLARCASDSNCEPGQGCYDVAGACVSTCADDADCVQGFSCDQSRTRPICVRST